MIENCSKEIIGLEKFRDSLHARAKAINRLKSINDVSKKNLVRRIDSLETVRMFYNYFLVTPSDYDWAISSARLALKSMKAGREDFYYPSSIINADIIVAEIPKAKNFKECQQLMEEVQKIIDESPLNKASKEKAKERYFIESSIPAIEILIKELKTEREKARKRQK